MRLKLREVVNLEGPVDISGLPPTQKLYVAIMTRWKETKYYKRKLEKSLESEHREKVKREEKLKEELLNVIYRELVMNSTLSSKGNYSCSKIVLTVDRGLEEELNSILRSREFVSFSLRVIDVDPDMLRSYNKFPVLLEVSRRMVGGVP